MKIAEIFYSIQGEGSLVGQPSVFVRVSGCPLRCVWCDSAYTSWNPEGKNMTISEIENEVKSYNPTHVVITGGEPMIYRTEMADLTRLFAHAGYHITIETTGRHYIHVSDLRCHLMSMSPKLANSIPLNDLIWGQKHQEIRWNIESQQNFDLNLLSYNYQIKFVVTSPNDMSEILEIVEPRNVDSDRIYLMPEGRTESEVKEKSYWLVDLCKEHGFRFSPRLQIDLWGNKRGV